MKVLLGKSSANLWKDNQYTQVYLVGLQVESYHHIYIVDGTHAYVL